MEGYIYRHSTHPYKRARMDKRNPAGASRGEGRNQIPETHLRTEKPLAAHQTNGCREGGHNPAKNPPHDGLYAVRGQRLQGREGGQKRWGIGVTRAVFKNRWSVWTRKILAHISYNGLRGKSPHRGAEIKKRTIHSP